MNRTSTRWPVEFGVGARGRLAIISVACVCAALPSLSLAQGDRRTFQPVEQGVADTGPLSTNRRVVPLDLRVPSGFDRVYKFGEGSSSKFARRSGGLTAVFPRSAYVSGASGTVAMIPPGTVFYVGKLPDSLFGGGVGGVGSRPLPRPLLPAENSAIDAARGPANRPQDPRQESRMVAPAGLPRESLTAFSVFDDERFRARRIDGLLERALRADEKPAGAHRRTPRPTAR